jgi:tetratricopeptide (TPR) repeat protein
MSVEVMQQVFRWYKQLFSKHPFVVIATFFLYGSLAFYYFVRSDLAAKWQLRSPDREIMEAQLQSLQQKLDQQDKVIDTLTKRTKESSFIRKLSFEESWKSDDNRANILRILEYADFAIEKEDYRRAESLYLEGDRVQPTLSIPYYLGRLYYIKGDLQGTERQWKKFIAVDSRGKYPEVRLYLAIVLYEMSKQDESKDLMRAYLTG